MSHNKHRKRAVQSSPRQLDATLAAIKLVAAFAIEIGEGRGARRQRQFEADFRLRKIARDGGAIDLEGRAGVKLPSNGARARSRKLNRDRFVCAGCKMPSLQNERLQFAPFKSDRFKIESTDQMQRRDIRCLAEV